MANIRKHGIDFEDIKDLLNHPTMMQVDSGDTYGETRWQVIGWIREVLGVTVYTERADDAICIISARKATKHEIWLYEKYFKN